MRFIWAAPAIIVIGLLGGAGGYYLGTRDMPGMPAGKPAPDMAQKPALETAGRKILYYRNPMGLPDTSPVPKKDWMGMDYIAVHDGEESNDTSVKVSVERVQRAGVRTARVERRVMDAPVRAAGTVQLDEGRIKSVTLRLNGFTEKLFANAPEQFVREGEPPVERVILGTNWL